ncbi:SIR2 family protein [Paenarthrobacter sp. NPDC089316]|uniref:SIR2 family protein n=1 Tax=unclassified Paenarthrobacter TaxID=2634190 RepID=UPI003442671A
MSALKTKKLLPFIGAGFSSAAGLPGWLGLLEEIYSRMEDPNPSFDAVRSSCNSDPLRIAEYMFLLAGEQIGPLRHLMTKQLTPSQEFFSSAHIELSNLALPVVYTTNFDELIEETYHQLNIPYTKMSTTRDLALDRSDRRRVMKFHGDMQHDSSLVLTEKSFFDRLDFSSPLDIRLRSDLLGKSILFLGYGFGDVNIRVLWHRLGHLMSDVPADERPHSFIVRLDADPVLEKLDRSVGLTTIALDPQARDKTSEEKTILLERFMLQLSLEGQAEDVTTPDPVCSPRLLAEAAEILRRKEVQPLLPGEAQLLEAASTRSLSEQVRKSADDLLDAYSKATLYGDAEEFRKRYVLNFNLSFSTEE